MEVKYKKGSSNLVVLGSAGHAPGVTRGRLRHPRHPHARDMANIHGAHSRIHLGSREAPS